MADSEREDEDRLDAEALQSHEMHAGLAYLVTGELGNKRMLWGKTPAQIATLNDPLKAMIDQNVRVKPRAGLSIFSRDAKPELGAKDRLKEILKAAEERKTLQEKERIALQAALRAGGYDVTIGDPLNDKHLAFAADFRKKLDGGQSLTEIANQTFKARAETEKEAKAAAEIAARTEREKANIKGQFRAGLAYAGYPPGADENSAAAAMNNFIRDNTPNIVVAADAQEKAFPNISRGDWTPGPEALAFIKAHTKGAANPTLQADLESGDSGRITRAQHFLVLNGYDAVQATGQIDPATQKAGEEMIRRPLTMPENLLTADGKPNYQFIYNTANTGQLHLPLSALTPAEQAVARTMPLTPQDRKPGEIFTQAQYIAVRLAEQAPNGKTRYENALVAENERRATLTLNAKLSPGAQKIYNEQLFNVHDRLPNDIQPDMPEPLKQLIVAKRAIAEGEKAVNDAKFALPELGNPDKDPAKIRVAAEQQREEAEKAYTKLYDKMKDDGRLKTVQDHLDGKPPAAPATPDSEGGAPLISHNSSSPTTLSFNRAGGIANNDNGVFEKPASGPTQVASLTDAYDNALNGRRTSGTAPAPATVANDGFKPSLTA